MDSTRFLYSLAITQLSVNKSAVVIIWCLTDYGDSEAISSKEICKIIEGCGFGKQNCTRVRESIIRDRIVVSHRKYGYRIHPNQIEKLRQKYQQIIGSRFLSNVVAMWRRVKSEAVNSFLSNKYKRQ